MTDSVNDADIADTGPGSVQHWANYGRPGEPQNSRVQPHARWGVRPFRKPRTAPWRVALNADDFRKLIIGFEPEVMEDKWLIYSTDPDLAGNISVHMHRSWTGFKTFQLTIESPTETDSIIARIMAITWETDKICRDDEHTAMQGARDVCRWIMDVHLGPEET